MIETKLATELPLSIFMSEVSDGNMATHTGLDIAEVAQHRAELVQRVGAPIQWLNQTHSAVVAAPQFVDANPLDADGCIGRRGFAVGILTADCLPVMLFSESGLVYAGVHAGWRGLLDGIVINAVRQLKCPEGSRLRAFIGPSISQAAYQVESDFVARFEDRWERDLSECYTPDGKNHVRVDLAGLASMQLVELGIPCALSKLCTATDPRFFSYRENKTAGRIATVIGG
ncbi:MAG: laccase domain-containing protein [Gammaproteobacteria bacterium]|nr:laccase domain-containing protein [Gammaproteobacteria bacterium]